MSVKLSTRQVDGITILDLSGRITLGEGSVQLRDAVRDLLGRGSKKILLNLGDVNYIDSSGIGELVSAYTTVRNQGGDLKLLNLTKKVHDLLQITKLYTVFGDIANARAGLLNAHGNPKATIQANNQLDSALGRLLAISENYPQLKSNANFHSLQDELSGTENRIAVARMRYNRNIQDYDTFIGQFPNSIWAGIGGFQRNNDYFEASPAAKNVPTVHF